MIKIPDFTKYLVPGVYVETGANPTVAPVGVDPTIVCIIGKGIGYNTYTETISLPTATSTAVLTKKGIVAGSISIRGYKTDPENAGLALPTTFVVTTDYTVAQDVSDGALESVTTVARVGAGGMENAYATFRVTYNYTDSDYHNLRFYDDFDSLQEVYGVAINPSTGVVQSPMTFAAQIAMENGANQVYAIALDGVGTVEDQNLTALEKLVGHPEINVIVPCWDEIVNEAAIAALSSQLAGFLDREEDDGNLRMAFVGFDQGYQPTADDLAALAVGVSNKRVVYAWPNRMNRYNFILQKSVIIDGFYLAAAYAGIHTLMGPQWPLTRKFPRGFAAIDPSIRTQMTKSYKNKLSSAGVSVTEVDRAGRMVVRHGLTTDYSGGILNREISLVRASDALYNLIKQTLDQANLIGTPIHRGTALQVKGVVSGGLEQAMSAGVIVDYTNLKVRQQIPPSGDPTVIEVKFAYLPSWPLNYILVTFTVDTTTQTTSVDASLTPVSDNANNNFTNISDFL